MSKKKGLDVVHLARHINDGLHTNITSDEISGLVAGKINTEPGFDMDALDEFETVELMTAIRRGLFLVVGELVFDEEFFEKVKELTPERENPIKSLQERLAALRDVQIMKDHPSVVDALHESIGVFWGEREKNEAIKHGQLWLKKGFNTSLTAHLQFAVILPYLVERDMQGNSSNDPRLLEKIYGENFAFLLEAARKANLQRIEMLKISENNVQLHGQSNGVIRARWTDRNFAAVDGEIHTGCPMAYSLQPKRPSMIWRMHKAFQKPVSKLFDLIIDS